MFIRARTSKGRSYLQLVRGYRDADGAVRQETIGLGVQSDPQETVSLTEAIKKELAYEREWLRKCRRGRGQWAKHNSTFAQKQHAKWERSVSRAEDKIKRLEAAFVDTTASTRIPAPAKPATGPTLTQQPSAKVPTRPNERGYTEETLMTATYQTEPVAGTV